MPYRVERTEQGDFAVLYYLSWAEDGTAEVFRSKTSHKRRRSRNSSNQRRQIVEQS